MDPATTTAGSAEVVQTWLRKVPGPLVVIAAFLGGTAVAAAGMAAFRSASAPSLAERSNASAPIARDVETPAAVARPPIVLEEMVILGDVPCSPASVSPGLGGGSRCGCAVGKGVAAGAPSRREDRLPLAVEDSAPVRR